MQIYCPKSSASQRQSRRRRRLESPVIGAALASLLSLALLSHTWGDATAVTPPNPTPLPALPTPATHPQWTFVEGGIIRAEVSRKHLSIIFTGGDFGEGTGHVLDTLAQHKIKASFFFTGDYLRKPE